MYSVSQVVFVLWPESWISITFEKDKQTSRQEWEVREGEVSKNIIVLPLVLFQSGKKREPQSSFEKRNREERMSEKKNLKGRKRGEDRGQLRQESEDEGIERKSVKKQEESTVASLVRLLFFSCSFGPLSSSQGKEKRLDTSFIVALVWFNCSLLRQKRGTSLCVYDTLWLLHFTLNLPAVKSSWNNCIDWCTWKTSPTFKIEESPGKISFSWITFFKTRGMSFLFVLLYILLLQLLLRLRSPTETIVFHREWQERPTTE